MSKSNFICEGCLREFEQNETMYLFPANADFDESTVMSAFCFDCCEPMNAVSTAVPKEFEQMDNSAPV